MKKKIGFIGTGKMAEALIKAFQSTELVETIIGSDKNEERLKQLSIETTKDNKEVINSSEIVFLSVKPQDMKAVLEEIKDTIKDQLIVSIAAGITINNIQSIIGEKKIVRVMPNTPCLIREMAAGYAMNNKVTSEERDYIAKLLNSAGTAILLEEKDLDAVTGLSGSGPAFIAYIIKAMAEAGENQGLKEEIAMDLTLQTMIGTAKLLKEKGMKPSDLIKAVSSPNGTTVAGREILEKSNIKEIIDKTIEKATKRSRELGKNQ